MAEPTSVGGMTPSQQENLFPSFIETWTSALSCTLLFVACAIKEGGRKSPVVQE